MQIEVYDRRTQTVFQEKVYGEGFIHAFYNFGAVHFFPFHLISKLFGWWQDTWLSTRKIASFVRDFSIDMQEYEVCDYRSFNQFFIRKFRPGARPAASEGLLAFAEGRYFAFDKLPEQTPIKGVPHSVASLLGRSTWVDTFANGPCFIARLCPVDYHRFHFPDAGEVLEQYREHGPLHSVNPIALARKEDVLCTNERHISILETKNYGKLAMIEIGAMMVGKIQQSHPSMQTGCSGASRSFARLDEKGYFLFGASCVVLFGEPGKWQISDDLRTQTNQGRESLVRLGEVIGK